MRKTLIVLVLLMATSVTMDAQVSRNTFSFGGGYSLPVGKFASERMDDPKAGLAGHGYFGQLAYERRLSSWIGIRLSGSYNENTTNPEPIILKANELIDMYRGLIDEWGAYSWEQTAGNWNLIGAMAGPVIYIHLGRVQLSGHIQGGRMFIQSPKVAVTGISTSGNNAVDATIERIRTAAWGLGGGVGLRIPISKTTRLQLSADALACEATFKDIALQGRIGDLGASQLMEETRPVGILNVGLGFVFDF